MDDVEGDGVVFLSLRERGSFAVRIHVPLGYSSSLLVSCAAETEEELVRAVRRWRMLVRCVPSVESTSISDFLDGSGLGCCAIASSFSCRR